METFLNRAPMQPFISRTPMEVDSRTPFNRLESELSYMNNNSSIQIGCINTRLQNRIDNNLAEINKLKDDFYKLLKIVCVSVVIIIILIILIIVNIGMSA